MEPCPPVPKLEGKTGKDLTEKLVELGEAYNDCRAKHDTLREYSKE